MPRSGFVLYTNALWYEVKRRFAAATARTPRAPFNQLFHPFRATCPSTTARGCCATTWPRPARPGLYLSFVNFSFFGDEGDVFGNVLAVLCGLAERVGHAHRRARCRGAGARAVSDPGGAAPARRRSTRCGGPTWRATSRTGVHQYHNGGIWPFVGGFWVLALARLGHAELAWQRAGRGWRRSTRSTTGASPNGSTAARWRRGHGRSELERGDLPARPARLEGGAAGW